MIAQFGIEVAGEPVGHLAGQRFATHGHVTQLAPLGRRRQVEQRAQRRGHQLYDGDPVPVDQIGEVAEIACARLLGHHQRGPQRQGQQHLRHRRVEAHRGRLQ